MGSKNSSIASVSDVQNTAQSISTSIPKRQVAAPICVPWLVGKGMQVEEQKRFHFSINHNRYSILIKNINHFKEWYCFTFLGKDKTTGHNVSLFLCNCLQGYCLDLKRLKITILMAWADIDMGIFYPHTTISSGILMTKGSKGNLNYSVNDVDKEVGFATTHDQIKERWHFKSFATNLSSMVAGTPYRVNVRGSIKKLGDIPIAYWGLENIEYDKNVDQKPSNRYGFMYYYTAPDMEMVGNVTLADGFLHEIEGTAWFEHQWGNFQSPEQTKYFWGYARFPNGDVITWQQHYGNLGGKLNAAVSFNAAATNFGWKDPHIEQNRFAFIPKDQPPQYTFGSEFVFTPIKWWTSLKSNITYPWWGQLKTPKGTFYLSPASQPAQEIISLEGAFIEGAMVLHNDSINGPVVAHGFCELVQLPALWAKYSNGLPERAVSENSYLDSV